MVFQDPYASLNPRKRVGQIISDPMRIHGIGDAGHQGAGRRSCWSASACRPSTTTAIRTSSPAASGSGSAWRARSRCNPKLIVADEPVSALDVSIQAQVVNLLDDLQDEFDLTYLFIAHDLAVVRHVSDRIAVMYLGKIVEVSPAEELYRRPDPPVHRGAALGGADPRSRAVVAARADRARGRRAQPDHAAQRLPVPSPLPLRDRDLRHRGAAAGRPRGRPPRRLPPPAERRRERPGVTTGSDPVVTRRRRHSRRPRSGR